MNGFYKFTLDFEENSFELFQDSANLVSTGKGRLGNHLVKKDSRGIPIVRTTTKYDVPANYFNQCHLQLVQAIKNALTDSLIAESIDFNNALIEVYNHTYRKMKYHSDQCLDIADNSMIAIFSCYEKPNDLDELLTRQLKIKNIDNGEENLIALTHNSIVMFSTQTNSQYNHKIVLEHIKGVKPSMLENKWLGITFRVSKTWIRFQNNIPTLANGKVLTLASEQQHDEFFILKSQENKNESFVYPMLSYTLNEADLLQPTEHSDTTDDFSL